MNNWYVLFAIYIFSLVKIQLWLFFYIFYIFYFDGWNVFKFSEYFIHSSYVIYKYFLLTCTLSFIFSTGSFGEKKNVNFNEIYFINFMQLYFGVIPKNVLPNLESHKVFLYFLLNNLCFCLSNKSIMYFELTLLWNIKFYVKVYLFWLQMPNYYYIICWNLHNLVIWINDYLFFTYKSLLTVGCIVVSMMILLMLRITNYQKNTNINYNEISPHPS